ncbi:MAG: TonB family protein [Novosphingobium sp.]
MAYATTRRNRPATIAAVGVLHAAAIYALVTGLAGPMFKLVEDKPLVGVNVPLPKLPPPETATQQQQQREARTVPTDHRRAEEVFVLENRGIADEGKAFVLPPFGGGELGGGETVLPPQPYKPPLEAFTPKLARPIGKPGLWVTPNDYPSGDLRAGHEGTTRFQLTIGTDGKVQACEITVSSGFASLDKAACDNLRKRGKFTAATGTDGAAVPGTYSSAVQWQIPKD